MMMMTPPLPPNGGTRDVRKLECLLKRGEGGLESKGEGVESGRGGRGRGWFKKWEGGCLEIIKKCEKIELCGRWNKKIWC